MFFLATQSDNKIGDTAPLSSNEENNDKWNTKTNKEVISNL